MGALAYPFPKDRKGFNVVLSALPLNGRLVLREFSEDDDKARRAKPPLRAGAALI
jgi:hypothetical protein